MNILHKLILSAAIGAGAAGFTPAYADAARIQTIEVGQARQMAGQGALLIDVREPGEYAEGHAPGSVLIPLGQLQGRLAEIQASRNEPVTLICHSGRRSARAAEILQQAGFSKVYNTAGGMNAWSAAGLPVVKGAK